MASLLIHDALLLTPDGALPQGWLLVEDGRIVQTGQGSAPTFEVAQRIDGRGREGWTTLPGFIDLHVHGAVGYDTMDATPEALRAMARFYAMCGVTGFLATTVTAPGEATQRALENIAACMGSIGPAGDGAALLGAHLEGPYINVEAKGAQEGRYVRRADPAEYTAWLDTGVIRQVTVAPEFPENQAFIRDCAARGINVSIGHTRATYEDIGAAVALGARQATHTFNAMTGLHHRKPGVAGAALTLEAITCEVIADNIHLHPAILKLIASAKGAEGVIIVTDAIRGAGMPDGVYDLGGQAVTVRDETATLADGTLAGSVLRMDQGVRNLLAATGRSLAEIWQMSSANAARQIGLEHHKGRLASGYDADVVLLDAANRVMLTIVGGQVVYSAAGELPAMPSL